MGEPAFKFNDQQQPSDMDRFIEQMKHACKLVMIELDATCKKADIMLEKMTNECDRANKTTAQANQVIRGNDKQGNLYSFEESIEDNSVGYWPER